MTGKSSSSNDSLLHRNLNSSTFLVNCFQSNQNVVIYSTLMIISTVILLPLCIFILYCGLRQWRQRSPSATMSHSDCLTFHMVIMELISAIRCFLCCYGIFRNNDDIIISGMYLFSLIWFGQLFLHLLLCVELFLAVVYPITYLSLKKERGIRIRNISIVCVWLLCFLGMILMTTGLIFIIVDLILSLVSLTIISFCSLSVLRVLVHPGPGGQGGGKGRANQMKLRAFYTIVSILGAVLVKFSWGLLEVVFKMFVTQSHCGLFIVEALLSLPSSLVVPLLFLHREGKLVCFNNNKQSG